MHIVLNLNPKKLISSELEPQTPSTVELINFKLINFFIFIFYENFKNNYTTSLFKLAKHELENVDSEPSFILAHTG